MPKLFNLEKFNDKLAQQNQSVYAISISTKCILLSNGLILTTEADIRNCKRRVMSAHVVWQQNFDDLYGDDELAKRLAYDTCQSTTSRPGGLNCWAKNSDKIRKNLNAGTPWNKGKKLHYKVWHKGLTKHTSSKLAVLSEQRKGAGNPMFGVNHTPEYKLASSKRMKAKILSGEFTPNTNNRRTNWDAVFNGKKYRSSWEALYHYNDRAAEYETLRIKYRFENTEYVYIVDFVNHNTKQAIEVKPLELTTELKTAAKLQALREWCSVNGYVFVLADKNFLLSKKMPSDNALFDTRTFTKIKKLYETN